MLSDRYLSVCLSVMLVYCGQTAVGWIKMKLGMQVGLGRGHILLDGDPAPPPPKRHSPQFLANICCGQIAGWTKIATWYGGRPQLRRLCVRWGPCSPPQRWCSVCLSLSFVTFFVKKYFFSAY